MCIGCGEAEERHHEGDMTYSDLEEAAADAGIDPEKAPDNIHAATRRALVTKMLRDVVTHAHMEEGVFYPFVRSLSKELNAEVLEGLAEPHAAKATLAKLRVMAPTHERFDAKVTVLTARPLARETSETPTGWHPRDPRIGR
jgi:hypothetical protein